MKGTEEDDLDVDPQKFLKRNGLAVIQKKDDGVNSEIPKMESMSVTALSAKAPAKFVSDFKQVEMKMNGLHADVIALQWKLQTRKKKNDEALTKMQQLRKHYYVAMSLWRAMVLHPQLDVEKTTSLYETLCRLKLPDGSVAFEVPCSVLVVSLRSAIVRAGS